MYIAENGEIRVSFQYDMNIERSRFWNNDYDNWRNSGILVDANPDHLFHIEPAIRVTKKNLYVFFKIIIANDDTIKKYAIDYEAINMVYRCIGDSRCNFIKFSDRRFKKIKLIPEERGILSRMKDIIFEEITNKFYSIHRLEDLIPRFEYIYGQDTQIFDVLFFRRIPEYKIYKFDNQGSKLDKYFEFIIQEDIKFANKVIDEHLKELNNLKIEFSKSILDRISAKRQFIQRLKKLVDVFEEV